MQSTRHHLFQGWSRWGLHHPYLALLLVLASVTWCTYLGVHHLRFATEPMQWLRPDHPSQRSWQEYRRQFAGQSDLLVLITGDTVEVTEFAEELGQRLEQDNSYFDDVFFKVDASEIRRHALYFLSVEDLTQLIARLELSAPWLASMRGGLEGLLDYLVGIPQGQARTRLEPSLGLFLPVLIGINECIESRGQGAYHSPLPRFQLETNLPGAQGFEIDQTVFYNFIVGQRTCMMLVEPIRPGSSYRHNAALLARLRWQVSEVQRAYLGVDCLVYGELVVASDEMSLAFQDCLVSWRTALLLNLGLLVLAFESLFLAMCSLGCIGVGLAWAIGLIAMSAEPLNPITLHCGLMVASLALGVAVQILCHYLHLKSHLTSQDPRLLLSLTMAQTGPALGLATILMVFPLGALQFGPSPALAQLGMVTGAAVVGCFLSIATCLPWLLALGESPRSSLLSTRSLWSAGAYRHPWLITTLSISLAVYGLSWVNRVPFEGNFLRLLAVESNVMRIETFLQSAGYSGMFAATTAQGSGEAYRLAKQFEALPGVSRVETVAALQPQRVNEKAPLVERVIALGLPLARSAPVSSSWSASEMRHLEQAFLVASAHLSDLLREVRKSLMRDSVQTQLYRLSGLLDPQNPGPLSSALLQYQFDLAQDMQTQVGFLRDQSPLPLQVHNALPPSLRTRNISPTGAVSLRIFPKANGWEPDTLRLFVPQLMRVDSEICGPAVVYFHAGQELQKGYWLFSCLGVGVAIICLLLWFRSPGLAALSFAPAVLSLGWLFALMGPVGMSFNSANALALPIVFGTGVCFAVRVLQNCLLHGVEVLFRGSTPRALMLTGLSSIVGFYSLSLASHLGVSSFASLMSLGLSTNLGAALIALPCLVSLLGFDGSRRRSVGSAHSG